jgi:hypothetical protein
MAMIGDYPNPTLGVGTIPYGDTLTDPTGGITVTWPSNLTASDYIKYEPIGVPSVPSYCVPTESPKFWLFQIVAVKIDNPELILFPKWVVSRSENGAKIRAYQTAKTEVAYDDFEWIVASRFVLDEVGKKEKE